MSWQFLKPFQMLLQKFRSAARLPPATIALVGLVWSLLWLARLLLLLVPLRFLAKFYGTDHGIDTAIPIASPTQIISAIQIGHAIALAVKYSPTAANCYPQALVARLLLWAARIPHGLFFGLQRGKQADMIAAHAWVMVGSVAVCGGNSFDNYVVVRSFITKAL
jgi:hypothetical protein